MDGDRPFTSFDHSLIRFDQDEGLWLNVLDVLATRFVLFNQAAVIRRSKFEELGGFREDIKYLEDYDLPLRLALEGEWAFIRDPLVTYGATSPESFSERAKRDIMTLHECELTIYRCIASRANNFGYQKARLHLERRWAMANRQLRAKRLQGTKQAIACKAATLLTTIDHYRMAVFRRSPWFPQPSTAPM